MPIKGELIIFKNFERRIKLPLMIFDFEKLLKYFGARR